MLSNVGQVKALMRLEKTPRRVKTCRLLDIFIIAFGIQTVIIH